MILSRADRGGDGAAMVGRREHVGAGEMHSRGGNRPRPARSADAATVGTTSFQPICGTLQPRRGSSADGARDPAQPGMQPVLLARIGEQLHADADAEERHTRRYARGDPSPRPCHRIAEARSMQAAKRPTPGSTIRSALATIGGIGGDDDVVGAGRDSALCDRAGDCPRRNRSARSLSGPRPRASPWSRGSRRPCADRSRPPAQCARASALERALDDVMIVLAVQRLDVQRDPALWRKAVEPVLEHLGVHLAEPRLREGRFPHEITAAPKCRARRASASRPSAHRRRRSGGCRACRPAPSRPPRRSRAPNPRPYGAGRCADRRHFHLEMSISEWRDSCSSI
jgi:hypothetical protein